MNSLCVCVCDRETTLEVFLNCTEKEEEQVVGIVIITCPADDLFCVQHSQHRALCYQESPPPETPPPPPLLFPQSIRGKRGRGNIQSALSLSRLIPPLLPPCGHFGTSGRTVYSQPQLLQHNNAGKEAYLPDSRCVAAEGVPFSKKGKRIAAKQNSVPKSVLVGEK